MKWLFVDTHYPMFLKAYYKKLKVLPKKFKTARNRLFKERFGTADFFSTNMRFLGDEAEEIIINDFFMQNQWLKERWYASQKTFKLLLSSWLNSLKSGIDSTFPFRIFEHQLALIRPTIVYLKNINYLPPKWLKRVKKYCRLLVGQVAYEIGPLKKYQNFDLIISSLPNLIERFRKATIPAEYLKIAFEPKIINHLRKTKKQYQVVFIGGFAHVHDQGTKVLEQIAKLIPFDVWGYAADRLAKTSPLKKRYHGEIWGKKMFNILYNSRVVLNRHSIVAGSYANNMRLYETTGVGSLLLTDYKKNNREFFIPGKEIIVYKNAKDAVGKIRYYLSHELERQRIARAGQKRTLKEHTYLNRMKELRQIISEYL